MNKKQNKIIFLTLVVALIAFIGMIVTYYSEEIAPESNDKEVKELVSSLKTSDKKAVELETKLETSEEKVARLEETLAENQKLLMTLEKELKAHDTKIGELENFTK